MNSSSFDLLRLLPVWQILELLLMSTQGNTPEYEEEEEVSLNEKQVGNEIHTTKDIGDLAPVGEDFEEDPDWSSYDTSTALWAQHPISQSWIHDLKSLNASDPTRDLSLIHI